MIFVGDYSIRFNWDVTHDLNTGTYDQPPQCYALKIKWFRQMNISGYHADIWGRSPFRQIFLCNLKAAHVDHFTAFSEKYIPVNKVIRMCFRQKVLMFIYEITKEPIWFFWRSGRAFPFCGQVFSSRFFRTFREQSTDQAVLCHRMSFYFPQIFAEFGYLVIWLFGYLVKLVIRLFGYSVMWLFG